MKEKLSKKLLPVYQSSQLRIRAAGSDGEDGTVEGIHLRWEYLGDLGENHLPKGNLAASGIYSSSAGYNKPNDFATLYRAPLVTPYPSIIDFTKAPARIQETSSKRVWHYENLTPISTRPDHKTHIALHFVDFEQYDSIRKSLDPNTSSLEFLTQYTGLLELIPQQKLAYGVNFKAKGGVEFAVQIEVGMPDTGGTASTIDPPSPQDQEDTLYLRIETISMEEGQDEGEKIVSSRVEYVYEGDTALQKPIYGHNIERIRFQYVNRVPYEATIYLYEDTIVGIDSDQQGWEKVGDFALSLDTTEVYHRLEAAPDTVHGKWPKYNGADTATGKFTVNTENYQNKWLGTGIPLGIKEGIEKYLEASRNGSRGRVRFDLQGSPQNNAVDIELLDPLLFASIDFHVARMLGLGHIDTFPAGESSLNEYAYIIAYNIPQTFDGSLRTHLSMSLPTSKDVQRLPIAPTLSQLKYGVGSDKSNQTTYRFTDDEGYDLQQPIRYINLFRSIPSHSDQAFTFFANSTEFELASQSEAVMYGIEYRRAGEVNYREPEILADQTFVDPFGLFEVAAIPEVPGQMAKLYTHEETETGIHEYQLYAINWFSRPGPPGNTLTTDETQFSQRNTLLPPTNVGVQIIQEERDVRIFTTQKEQERWAAIDTSDKTLVRAEWEWLPTNLQSYQWGKYMRFTHRQESGNSVRGKVAAVNAHAQRPDLFYILSSPYLIVSRLQEGDQGPESISEEVALTPQNKTRFLGGICSVDNISYILEDVDFPSGTPRLLVKAPREVGLQDPDFKNILRAAEYYVAPKEGKNFLVVENLTHAENWETLLTSKVYLVHFHQADNFALEVSSGAFEPLTIRNVSLEGNQTVLTLQSRLSRNAVGFTLHYELRFKASSLQGASSSIIVPTDLSGRLPTEIQIEGTGNQDGTYTIDTANCTVANGITTLVVNEVISDYTYGAFVILKEQATISGQDFANQTLSLSGDLTEWLIIPRWEASIGEDGTPIHSLIGGLTSIAHQIEEIPQELKDNEGTIIETISDTGVFKISWNTHEEPLLPLPTSPHTTWHKGTIRIMENPAHFDANSPNYRPPRYKSLEILTMTLAPNSAETPGYRRVQEVVAQDPTHRAGSNYANPEEDYMPIATGIGVEVNIHPGYRSYLYAQAGFEESTLLPAMDVRKKFTFLGFFAENPDHNHQSPVSAPVGILAQNLTEPEAPGVPTGAAFATRPDYFGKSSYTVDVPVNTANRIPNSLIFLRTNEQNILSALYTEDTIAGIEQVVRSLSSVDMGHYEDAWRDVVSGNFDASGQYPEKTLTDGTTLRFFPNPDHPQLYGDTPPSTIPAAESMASVIQTAIERTFIGLTEQPMAYGHLQTGRQTYKRPPTLRDDDGNLYPPTHENFDPFPMATRFELAGQTIVRFTDFALDGASNSLWFYAARELSNQMKFGEFSPTIGPVRLLNTKSPQAPTLKKTSVQLANPALDIKAGVNFEVNLYLPEAKVERIRMYRTTSPSSVKSVRNMHLAGEYALTDALLDTFEDLASPPFGEVIYYRLVALKRIANEIGETEYIPSVASAPIVVNLVDNINPEAPEVSIQFAENTTDHTLENVVLSWSRTAQRASYSAYKMSTNGQWKLLSKVRTLDDAHHEKYSVERQQADGSWHKDETIYSAADAITLALEDSREGTSTLNRINDTEDIIYHRFKVDVTNSSGLLNRKSKEKTI